MVAAYALGVLAPAVAFACADQASILHVLSESHGGMLTLHFHDNDGDHHDHPAKPGSGPMHHCCGVVSLPGIAPSAAISIIPPQTVTALLPHSERSLPAAAPNPPERPPKPFLTA